MGVRHLYIARHGAADVFGNLTDIGRRQAQALAERLADLPITAIRHSPLPRAEATARVIAECIPSATCGAADELIDNIPYVPTTDECPPAWTGFFDGYDDAEARSGSARASTLTARFAEEPDADSADSHEVLITHDYPIAWLVRDALRAPSVAWLGMTSANAALTVLTYGTGRPPSLMMFNDMSHLGADLRWSGFPSGRRP